MSTLNEKMRSKKRVIILLPLLFLFLFTSISKAGLKDEVFFEKAGIFRPRKPAICADPDPPQSLVKHANTIGADLLRVGHDYWYEQSGDAWLFRMGETELGKLPMPAMAGAHQLVNAATALAALAKLADVLPVSLAAIHAGLKTAHLPGRFQRIPGRVEVVLDVAHNPQSARVLAANLCAHPAQGKTYAVFALLADKDAAGVIEPLRNCFDAWFVAGLAGERGQSGEALGRGRCASSLQARSACSRMCFPPSGSQTRGG